VIKKLSLDVQAGESVALMGPSGSGKSTLLNLISGLELPSQGKILLGSTEINTLSAQQRENYRLNNISYVYQSFHLLPTLTALENCVFVAMEQKKRHADAIIRSALLLLEELGLSDAVHKFPSQLSGGMQARVALARALIAEPALILADEPTGNLDSKTGALVLDLLFREQKERQFTLLLVTHDFQAAQRAQRIIKLSDGRVIA
jgi:putative ABC transport system ATP-binding protein